MKKLLYLLPVLILLTACEKKYKYVEIVKEQSFLNGSSIKEKNEDIISAPSDSAAYIDAFTSFCISQKVYYDMQKKGWGDHVDIPISFKLYNSEGVDISNIVFATKTKQKEEIVNKFLSSRNVVVESKKDSVKIKELLPFFSVKKDEFDPKGYTWYIPKSAPKYTSREGIFLYFATQDGKVQPLRFRVQYVSENWLFIRKIQFSIDGNAYEFIPSNPEGDNRYDKIWEWFDESLSVSDKDLIYALVNAKSAKMKFIGRQYYKVRTINKNQITDMNRTLELYRAMGGTY